MIKVSQVRSIGRRQLLKQASPKFSDVDSYRRVGAIGGGVGGAVLGGLGGTITGAGAALDDENKGHRFRSFSRHVLLGALIGGSAGALGGRYIGTNAFSNDYPMQAALLRACGQI